MEQSTTSSFLYCLLLLVRYMPADADADAGARPRSPLPLFLAALRHWEHTTINLLIDPTDEDIDQDFGSLLGGQLSHRRVSFLSPDVNANVSAILQHESKVSMHVAYIHTRFDRRQIEEFSGQIWFHRMVWLLPARSVTEMLTNLKLRLDSQLYTYQFNDGGGCLIEEVYSIKNGSKRYHEVAFWSELGGLDFTERHIHERRSNLSGILIRNIVIEMRRFQELKFDKAGEKIISGTGYHIEIVNNLQRILLFDHKLLYTPDGYYGSLVDGKMNGMVGALQREEADISSVDLSITIDRSQAIDFTISVYQDEQTIVMGKPDTVPEINFLAYINIFNVNSWLFAGLTMSSLAVALFMVSHGGGEKFHKDGEHFGLVHAFGVVVTTLALRDYSLLKKKMSSNLLFWVISTFGFLVFSFYSAVLTSLMTGNPPPIKIKSFGDILALDYQLGVRTATSMEEALVRSNPTSVLHEIYYETMQDKSGVFWDNTDDIAKHLGENKKLTCFCTKIVAMNYDELISLKLTDSITDAVAFGLQKNSEFREIFNYYLKKFEEHGLLLRMRQKWIPSDNANAASPPSLEVITLGYNNLTFPCLILSVGAIGGLVLVLVEKGTSIWNQTAVLSTAFK